MPAILKFKRGIHEEIEQHVAWLGSISGLKAEKLVKDRMTPYLYILRADVYTVGCQKGYYVTFLRPDQSIEHCPFVITELSEGWCYNHGKQGGPFKDASIDDVLHLIMHCEKKECVPFVLKEKVLFNEAFKI